MTAPNLTAKQKAAKLERIIESHFARERRTLADIRNLGYNFRSVNQAQAYAKAQATLDRLSHEELIELVQRLPTPRQQEKEGK